MRRSFLGAIVPVAVAAMMTACSTTDSTTEPTGTPVTVDWALCANDANLPTWFAVKDGSGAWTRITPAGGLFSFSVSSTRIGIAEYSNGSLQIFYATRDEVVANKPSCTGSRRTVSGSVTSFTIQDNVSVQIGESGSTFGGGSTPPQSFTLGNVAPGAVDVLAVKSRSTFTGSTLQDTPSSVLIRRAQTANALAPLDFASVSEAAAPTSRTATVTNAATGEFLNVTGTLVTPTTQTAIGGYSTTLGAVSGAVTAPFYGLAGTRLVAGEAQLLTVVSDKTTGSIFEFRTASAAYTDVVDKSLVLGPALGTINITGTARPSARYTIQTGYDQTFSFAVDQGSGASGHSVSVLMTRAYAGAAATEVTLAVPDLSGVTGFVPTWLIVPGTTATWSFFATSGDIKSLSGGAVASTGAARSSPFTP